MAQFNYRALDTDNKSHSGTLEAADRVTAISMLSGRGLRPIKVNSPTSKSAGKGFSLKSKVKTDDLVMFTRQLSAMVSAGVPLLRALGSLQENSDSQAMRKVVGAIYQEIQGGAALADALEKHPDVFNDIYVNMVRAGEAAGILDEILKRLAVQQEKAATIRKKIKSAMTYPMVLVAITVLAFFGLMMFVIPQIGKIVKDLGGPDAELPVLTQVMLSISDFMLTFWYLLLPGIVGGIFFLLRFIKTPKGKAMFHRFVLKVPGIKNIIIKVAVARFARTFSALMGAGVAVLEALDVTAHAVGNVVFEQALLDASAEVKNGAQLSGVIGKNKLFPSIVSQMLAVGEETGQTDTVLIKVADYYEEEVDVAIDGLSSIIEPFMIVFMGGMVGVIAASVMMPIANLSQTIK